MLTTTEQKLLVYPLNTDAEYSIVRHGSRFMWSVTFTEYHFEARCTRPEIEISQFNGMGDSWMGAYDQLLNAFRNKRLEIESRKGVVHSELFPA